MGLRVMSVYPTTSETKVAVFDDGGEICRAVLRHDPYDIHEAKTPYKQFLLRKPALDKLLKDWLPGAGKIGAVIGCALVPSARQTGVYLMDDEFIKQMRSTSKPGRIINQGAMLASYAAESASSGLFAMVPFLVTEFDAIYRISGVQGMNFGRMTHTLRMKTALDTASAAIGKSADSASLVIAYLGKNFSFCSHSGGRIRDLSNAFERGPFSLYRSGSVPATEMVRMAYSGTWSKMDLIRLACYEGGVESYTGVRRMDDIISRAESGDNYASLVLNAMTYQISCEITAQATALRGAVDAIVLTGEFAENEFLTQAITERVSWITGRILKFKGEDELVTIAKGAFRALGGAEASVMRVTPPGGAERYACKSSYISPP